MSDFDEGTHIGAPSILLPFFNVRCQIPGYPVLEIFLNLLFFLKNIITYYNTSLQFLQLINVCMNVEC